jgi:hypothetical protein
MHEKFRRRIEELEEARRKQDEPLRIVRVVFVGADRKQISATVAQGPAGFVCHRGKDEDLDAFQSRASDECRATCARGPVFLDDDPDDDLVKPTAPAAA